MIHYNLEQHTEKVDINDRKVIISIVMVASRVTLEPVEQQQLTLHIFLLFLQYHKNRYN
ncbi:hypothetical protein T12_14998 [Trichinella patagoniensis]|uniref:Uncharacterized protein n=1 Tax=Trichinella patagoniensis TaxID=990121 RepID=A0A0V0ZSJ0_9BILA|nr:hypothetical protein T12_14998 [Trichinella patagoniensis]